MISDTPGYLLLGIFSIFAGLSESLKDVRISVPQVICRGETAVFMCDFDLEGDSLYSVKWYKGKSEFFRFTPKDEFPIKIFPIEGLNIDKSKSNMTRLTVENVQPSLSGKYSCEVSAESSFHTALVSAVMDVVDIPQMDPILEGVRRRYKIGDMLDVNCTSGKSNPPVNLTWFVNDQMASSKQVIRFKDHLHPDEDGLASSKSSIRFVVTTHDFLGGRLKLRCLATIQDVYHKSTVAVIAEDNPFVMDATQMVVSANFQDSANENNEKKRHYSDESSGGSTVSRNAYGTLISMLLTYFTRMPR